jgi:hypothetical protein
VISASFLKHAHDWLADSGERRLWPGNRANSIDDLIRLRIDEHFEELFATLRVVRQRSIGEAIRRRTSSQELGGSSTAMTSTEP